MRGAVVDEQDLDALSEGSFDFGHFQDLDSDVDEREVENDSVDPFTAAQREQAGSQEPGAPVAANEYDSLLFTQRLLTNARTLKQLRQSGAPEVEISYEKSVLEDQKPGRVVPPDHDVPSAQGLGDNAPPQSAHRVQSSQYSDPSPLKSQRSQPSSARQPFSRERWDRLSTMDDHELVYGRYESVPVNLLRPYSFAICRLILDQTRRYQLSTELDTAESLCLQDLWRAVDLSSTPVLRVMAVNGHMILLEDKHQSAAPCTSVAYLNNTSSATVAVDSHIRLLDFHFDHVAKTNRSDRAPRNVTMVEEADEAFSESCFSSAHSFLEPLLQAADEVPFPAAQPAERHSSAARSRRQGRDSPRQNLKVDPSPVKESVVIPDQDDFTSLLVISKYETVDLDSLVQEQNDRRQKQQEAEKLYDLEAKFDIEPATQATVETNYSDKFEGQLDPNDFPLDLES